MSGNNKSFSFGADADHDLDPRFLTKFLQQQGLLQEFCGINHQPPWQRFGGLRLLLEVITVLSSLWRQLGW